MLELMGKISFITSLLHHLPQEIFLQETFPLEGIFPQEITLFVRICVIIVECALLQLLVLQIHLYLRRFITKMSSTPWYKLRIFSIIKFNKLLCLLSIKKIQVRIISKKSLVRIFSLFLLLGWIISFIILYPRYF